MRATTTPLTNCPAASACDSSAISFTSTGPMFMRAKANSEAMSR